MEADLDLKIYRAGNVPVVDLAGDLDTYTCSRLREAILDLIENGESRIVIGMSKVNYIDSSGLGTLVGGLRRVGELNGGLAISGASEQIKKVFSITGLNKVFRLFDDDASAARSLEG
jgi:anti-sigma B factor antagonist